MATLCQPALVINWSRSKKSSYRPRNHNVGHTRLAPRAMVWPLEKAMCSRCPLHSAYFPGREQQSPSEAAMEHADRNLGRKARMNVHEYRKKKPEFVKSFLPVMNWSKKKQPIFVKRFSWIYAILQVTLFPMNVCFQCAQTSRWRTSPPSVWSTTSYTI